MFIPPVYVASSAYVLMVETVSKSDRHMLKNLHEAISKLSLSHQQHNKSDEVLSNRQFERQYPVGNARKWQALRSGLVSNPIGYNDLTFLLCYYHIAYAKNVDRLLLQYRLWNASWKASTRDKPDHYSDDVIEDTPDYLQLLYLRYHDSLSLGALLGLRSDGAPAEILSDVIADLWGRNPVPLLISAADSAKRVENIAVALWMNGGTRAIRQDQLRELKRLSKHSDKRVASTAKKVEQNLRKTLIEQPNSP